MASRAVLIGGQRGLLLIATLVAIAVSGMVALKLAGGAAPPEESYSLDGLAVEVADNYRFISEHREHAARIPCYCGCETYDHRHLLDCFVKPDGGWEEHATWCRVCQDEAVDVRAMLAEGRSIEDVRAAIDEKYASLGKPTNTP